MDLIPAKDQFPKGNKLYWKKDFFAVITASTVELLLASLCQ